MGSPLAPLAPLEALKPLDAFAPATGGGIGAGIGGIGAAIGAAIGIGSSGSGLTTGPTVANFSATTTSADCNLLDPSTWATACLERLVILLLGLICIIAGLYFLKPSAINAPIIAIKNAAAVAAKTAATAAPAAA